MRTRTGPIETIEIEVTEVGRQADALVERVRRGEARVLLEKDGVAVAALVSSDDLDRLATIDQQRDRAFEAIERISAAFIDVPVGELEREVERALMDARRKARKEAAPRAAPE